MNALVNHWTIISLTNRKRTSQGQTWGRQLDPGWWWRGLLTWMDSSREDWVGLGGVAPDLMFHKPQQGLENRSILNQPRIKLSMLLQD
jgi:hypothetical protein